MWPNRLFVWHRHHAPRPAFPHPALHVENLEDRLNLAPTVSVAAMPSFLYTSALNQTIDLLAHVTDYNQPLGYGQVTFTVSSIGYTGALPVAHGQVQASFVIPGGTPAGLYFIQAHYSDPGGTEPAGSGGTTLSIESPVVATPLVTVSLTPATLQTSSGNQTVTLKAHVRDFSTGNPVTVGLVQFTVFNGLSSNSSEMGHTGSLAVGSDGRVQAPFTVPGGKPAGTYLVLAAYHDPSGVYASRDGSDELVITRVSPPAKSKAVVAVTPVPATLQESSEPQQVVLQANARDFSTGQLLTSGTIAFTVFAPGSTDILGQTSPVAVDSQGKVAVSFTIPGGAAAGTCLVTANYSNPGGNYTDGEGSATITIAAVSPPTPVNTLPAQPAVPSPSTAPIQSLSVASVFPLPAWYPVTTTTVNALPPQPAPAQPVPVLTPMVVTLPLAPAFVAQVLGTNAPMWLVSLTPALQGTGAPGPQITEELPPSSPVATAALRLGTALTDADDSAELFYSMAARGRGATLPVVATAQKEMSDQE